MRVFVTLRVIVSTWKNVSIVLQSVLRCVRDRALQCEMTCICIRKIQQTRTDFYAARRRFHHFFFVQDPLTNSARTGRAFLHAVELYFT